MSEGNEIKYGVLAFLCILGAETIPKITGPDAPLVVGEQYYFTCFIGHVWLDNVTFSWTVNNQNALEHAEEFRKHGDNTVTFKSILTYTVTEIHDLLELTCIVESPYLGKENSSVSSAIHGEKTKKWKF